MALKSQNYLDKRITSPTRLNKDLPHVSFIDYGNSIMSETDGLPDID